MNRRRDTWNGLTVLGAVGAGATLMYLYDPNMGRRRRALVRDKLTRAGHVAQEGLTTAWRDARNRGRGLVAEASGRWRRGAVDDRRLCERVRSKLGTLVRHPSAITVTAEQGRVTVSGPVLDREADQLLRGVRRVLGVRDVIDRLEIHKQAGDVPALQGDPPRAPRGEPAEWMQANWSPTMRLFTGAAGTWVTLYGITRRTVPGVGLGLTGATVLARAAMNKPVRRLLGVGAGHRAVDIDKTIRIHAPLERVYALWANYRDFPRYTSHVREVLEQGEGRSRWTVVGPGGAEFSWTAVITSNIPREELAWKTEPGSPVQHAGLIRFHADGDGTTVDIKISYNPPGGAVMHRVAAWFGQDLESWLEEDLVRLKTVLEEAAIPRDAQQRGAIQQLMLKAEQG